jgi:hypothetical protein
MFHHPKEMKYPTSDATINSILNSLYDTKINPKESLEMFAKRLRSNCAICTNHGIPHDEKYLVRCFIRGLDTNFDYTRNLLSNNAISWYNKDLNAIVQLAKNMKLTRETTGDWITVTSSAKPAAGKQGSKRPDAVPNPPTQNDNDSTTTEDSYLSKKSN